MITGRLEGLSAWRRARPVGEASLAKREEGQHARDHQAQSHEGVRPKLIDHLIEVEIDHRAPRAEGREQDQQTANRARGDKDEQTHEHADGGEAKAIVPANFFTQIRTN